MQVGTKYAVVKGDLTKFVKLDMGTVAYADRPMKSGMSDTADGAQKLITKFLERIASQMIDALTEGQQAEEALRTKSGAYYEQECQSWITTDTAHWHLETTIVRTGVVTKNLTAVRDAGFGIVRITTEVVDV